MQEYIDQTKIHQPSDVDVSMDSYIKAYHISHEDYQNSEETKHEEIQRKNRKGNFTENDKTSRDKRSPAHPDLIKFEISDAKNPDFNTNQQETGRNLRMPFKISDAVENSPKSEKLMGGYFNNREMIPTKSKEEQTNDQSIDESRMIKITHPIMHKNHQRQSRMHSINEFPIAVQKAIDMVLREPNPTNGPAKLTVSESEKSYYGDKIPKIVNHSKFEPNQLLRNYPNNQWWTPSDVTRQKRLYYRPTGQISNNFIPSQPQPNIQYIFKETPIISNENKEFQYTTVASRAVTPVPQTMKQFSSEDYTTNPYGPVELHFAPTQQTKFEDTNYYAKPVSSQEETGFNVHEVTSIQKPQEDYKFNSPSSTPAPRFLSTTPNYYSSGVDVRSSQEQSTQKPQYLTSNEFTSAVDEGNYNIYYASTQKPQFQQSSSSFEENSYEREGSSIAALTALIGQTPTIQLQRLNELLIDGKPRPQDSTAPILFHPGQKPTMPQSPHLLPSRPYAPDSFYKTPNNQLYYNHQPKLKDHTPIVENSSERPPNPLSAEFVDLDDYNKKSVKDTRKVREVSLKKLSKNKLKLRGKRDLDYIGNIFLDQTVKRAPSIPITKKIGLRKIRYIDRMLDYLTNKNNEFLKTFNPDEQMLLSRKKRDLTNSGRSRIIFDNPFVLKPIASKLTNSQFPENVTFAELKNEGHNLGKVRLQSQTKFTTKLLDPQSEKFISSSKDDLDDYNDSSFDEHGTIVHDDFEYYDDKYLTTTKAPPTRRFNQNRRKLRPTKTLSPRSDYFDSDSWEHTSHTKKPYDYILGQPVSDLAKIIRSKVVPQWSQGSNEDWVDSVDNNNPYDPNYKLIPMTVYKKVPIHENIFDTKTSSHNDGEIHIENLNIFHTKSETKHKSHSISKPKKPQKQQHHHHPHHHTSKKVFVSDEHNNKQHQHDDSFNESFIPLITYFPPGALGH